METAEVCPVALVFSSSSDFLAGRPRFRPSVALTFVAVVLAGFFATEALGLVLAGSRSVDFPLIELLVERGAAAAASEVLLGLDDDAVGSGTCFCLFFAALSVGSAATFALRLAGAMISTALKIVVSQKCDSEV